MLEPASLTAVMTIAGAFCVGVMAARRLRQSAERQRALAGEDPGDRGPLAIAAHAPSSSAAVARIRDAVAEQLDRNLDHAGKKGIGPDHPTARDAEQLSIETLRMGDIVAIETIHAGLDGDFVVEGLVRLQEGGRAVLVLVLADGGRERWLIGAAGDDRAVPGTSGWLVVEPVRDHGVEGEPPRNIQLLGTSDAAPSSFGLRRRGQASVACLGRHGRPGLGRVATYVYGTVGDERLWVERWGREVLVGRGRPVDPDLVSFLPGS